MTILPSCLRARAGSKLYKCNKGRQGIAATTNLSYIGKIARRQHISWRVIPPDLPATDRESAYLRHTLNSLKAFGDVTLLNLLLQWQRGDSFLT